VENLVDLHAAKMVQWKTKPGFLASEGMTQRFSYGSQSLRWEVASRLCTRYTATAD
jgi:hypothetical protein